MVHAGIPVLRLLTFALMGAILITTGCSKKPKPATDVTTTAPPPAAEPARPDETTKPPAEIPAAETALADVYFDYDKYNLRDDARQTLEKDAHVLLENPGTRVLLEGHCDERGTVEYNLALGERRAQSARSFLIEFGVDAGRINTISYGEERPFAQGHDESAWAQNRRVHFVTQK